MGVSQCGFDQLARGTADLRKRPEKVESSNAYRLAKARSGTVTSVVAITRSHTQNGEETTIECWWLDLLDTGYFMPPPHYWQRETRVRQGNEGGALENLHSRLRDSKRRQAKRSRATVSMKSVVRKWK